MCRLEKRESDSACGLERPHSWERDVTGQPSKQLPSIPALIILHSCQRGKMGIEV